MNMNERESEKEAERERDKKGRETLPPREHETLRDTEWSNRAHACVLRDALERRKIPIRILYLGENRDPFELRSSKMADPFAAENDDEWSQCFAALHNGHKEKVIEAVTGESNQLSLQNSNITHLPHLLFNESRGLTELNL